MAFNSCRSMLKIFETSENWVSDASNRMHLLRTNCAGCTTTHWHIIDYSSCCIPAMYRYYFIPLCKVPARVVVDLKFRGCRKLKRHTAVPMYISL